MPPTQPAAPRRIKLILGGLLLTALVLALIAIVPATTCRPPKHGRVNQRTIAVAAELYVSEHEQCPTVADLKNALILARDVTMLDDWSHEFRILCHDKRVVVRSAGPDGAFNTEDDTE